MSSAIISVTALELTYEMFQEQSLQVNQLTLAIIDQNSRGMTCFFRTHCDV